MVQFLSIIFFLGFLQFLLGFSKVPVFLCHPMYIGHSAMEAYPSSLKIRHKWEFCNTPKGINAQRPSLTFLAKVFSVFNSYEHPVRMGNFSDATCELLYFPLFRGH